MLSVCYLALARGLTLTRLTVIIPFLFLLEQTAREGPELLGLSLVVLYLFIALSDLLDGAFARMAGAPSLFWGRIDAVADIVFNTLSLAVAAGIGLIGAWVPAGIAVLGGRFIVRSFKSRGADQRQPAEDQGGKIAGVLYYLLVGAIVLELAFDGNAGRWWVARAGDALFLYTLFLLLRRRRVSPSAASSEQVAVGPGQKNHTEGSVR